MRLSEREQEILNLISAELDYKQIAGQLFLSVHTVISHRKNIKKKLGVKNSAGLVREGFNRGYLRLTAVAQHNQAS